MPYDKKWYERNKEKKKAAAKKWRENNPEKVAEMRRRYCREHVEEIRQKRKSYTASNSERLSKYHADYRDKNRESINAKIAKYQRSIPEKRRQYRSKRRAIQKGAIVGDVTAISAWESTWRGKRNVRCYWCCGLFSGKQCHADHVVALSKGGFHHLDNLVIACGRCNSRKRAEDPIVFNTKTSSPRLFV